jgi:predicted SprT family Zn-dependent metalloprotease
MLRKISYMALLLLIGLGACRKKQFEELKQTNNKDAKAIEQSSVWFDDQKLASLKPLSTARGTTIDSIPFHPVWEVAVTHQLADNNKLVLAPVWRYANVQYANQRGFLRLLVVKLNSSDEIIAGNIVEIMAEKNYLKQNQQDIMKWYFEGNMRDFTGDILFHALTRNLDFQMGKRYANGQFVSDVKIYKFNIAPNANQRSDSPECPNPPCDDTGTGESQSRAGEMVSIPIPSDQLSSTLSNAVLLAGQLANQNIASVVSSNPPPTNTGGGSYTPMPNNYIWFYGNNWGGLGNSTPPNDGGQPITGIDYGMGFDANVVDYNGVNLAQNYQNAQGRVVPVDNNMLQAFKFVIDNSTYRNLISAYLAPNTDKLKIAFDINAGGGYFDNATSTMYINPNQLENLGMLDMVTIMVHESIHAMFFRPTATIQSQLATAQANLATHYTNPPATTNMIHHEAMGLYYKNQSISILKDFHNSSLGAVQNHTPIDDNHFEAIFLYSLRQVQYNGSYIRMWITAYDGRSYAIRNWFSLKCEEIRNIYINDLNP